MKTIIFVQNAVFIGDNHGQLMIEAVKFAVKQESVPQYIGCAIDDGVLELHVEFSKTPEQLLHQVKVDGIDLDAIKLSPDIKMELAERDLPDHEQAVAKPAEQGEGANCYDFARQIQAYIPEDEKIHVPIQGLIMLGFTKLKLLRGVMSNSMALLMRRILVNIVKNPSRLNESCVTMAGKEHSLCALVYCVEWVTSNEKYGFWNKIYETLKSDRTDESKAYIIRNMVDSLNMEN